MDRSEAARLLGVPEDAEPALVRRAYRTWARIAHPDMGGDPEHFARLAHARRTLLRPRATDHTHMPAPPPRAPLSAVVHLPARWLILAATGVLCVACVDLPSLGANAVASAFISGIASATWAWWASRASLRADADAGHRIVMLTLSWLPLALAQIGLALLLGSGVMETLPLLALPFAAVVASINIGAGLWRPVT